MGIFDKIPIVGDIVRGGLDMIGAKYGSDLQGHENDRMREYNLNMAREMFDKQVAENLNVWNRNKAYDETVRNWDRSVEQDVFNRNVMRADDVWARETGRADSIWEREKAYNLDLWAKQNEYNSPKAQMQRLEEAGLNPNLMYGQGTTGIAAAIRGSDIGSPSYGGTSMGATKSGRSSLEAARTSVPDYGEPVRKGEMFQRSVAGALDRYVSIRNADLRAKNMDAQAELIDKQGKQIDALIGQINANKDKTKAETEALNRENNLLRDTGTSSRDPFPARLGGRVARWLRNKLTGRESSIADDGHDVNFKIKLEPNYNWQNSIRR